MSFRMLQDLWTTLRDRLLALLRRPQPTNGPSRRAKWTFMVYIAGDNNLEASAFHDLSEMKAVGSTSEVNVVAQFDGLTSKGSRRYYLTNSGSLESNVVARLPEVNTGDPQALADFLRWGFKNYPAEKYALVLWNHGAGWKDTDIYRGLAVRGFDPKTLTRGQVRSLSSGNSSRALFRSSLEQVAIQTTLEQRAILYDDSSTDFLDNIEMKSVLDQAVVRLGRKIDLLGCDACLMNMVEVGYQLKSACRYLVASQEEEPGDGWPYDLVLRRLVDQPTMSPALLAAAVVEEYCRFYRERYPSLPITQSALNLDKLDALAWAVDELSDALCAVLKQDWNAGNAMVSLASYDVQKFTDRDYVDLVHFCQLLAEQNPNSDVAAAASKVVNLVKRGGEESPVVAEGHGGPGMRFTNGVSIYLPDRSLSPLYGRLEYAEEHRWLAFLEANTNPRYRAVR